MSGTGIDPEAFAHRDGAAFRAAHDLRDRLIVGFVGRQDVLKGVPVLIEAMRAVWRAMSDAVLLMAGPSRHRDEAVTAALAALPPRRTRECRPDR